MAVTQRCDRLVRTCKSCQNVLALVRAVQRCAQDKYSVLQSCGTQFSPAPMAVTRASDRLVRIPRSHMYIPAYTQTDSECPKRVAIVFRHHRNGGMSPPTAVTQCGDRHVRTLAARDRMPARCSSVTRCIVFILPLSVRHKTGAALCIWRSPRVVTAVSAHQHHTKTLKCVLISLLKLKKNNICQSKM